MTSQQQFEQYNSLVKIIDQLSAKISQKTKELDEYKQSYDAKLKTLNKYIRAVKGYEEMELNDEECDTQSTRRMELTRLNGKWRNDDGVEYMLIPVVPNHSNTELDDDTSMNDMTIKTEDLHIVPSTNTKNHLKKSKKKNCSYCHEMGHNRAACPKRL